MTPAALARLRALCDAATPPQWHLRKFSYGYDICLAGVSGPQSYGGWFLELHHVLNGRDDEELWRDFENNAAFIAAARDAVPMLLDEVQRLTTRERELKLHGWQQAARAEHAEAEVERLTVRLANELATNERMMHSSGGQFATIECGAAVPRARAEKAEALLREIVEAVDKNGVWAEALQDDIVYEADLASPIDKARAHFAELTARERSAEKGDPA